GKTKRAQTTTRPASEKANAKRIKSAAGVVADLVRQHGSSEFRVDPDAPVVLARLPVDGIMKLAKRDEVLALFLHEPKGILDLKDSMAIAQSDKVHSNLSITGSGVDVAVYEDGPDDTTNLSIASQFLTNPATSQHARHTH